MIKIGINVDNWRHVDRPVDYCFAFIAKQGVEYAELEASNGDDFIEGLGYSPYVSLNSDPVEIRKKAEKYGLKFSQIDVAFPINRWECIDYIRRGILIFELGRHSAGEYQRRRHQCPRAHRRRTARHHQIPSFPMSPGGRKPQNHHRH